MVHYTGPNNSISKLELLNTYMIISSKILSLVNESSLQDFERCIKSMDVKSKGFINSTDPSSIPLIGSLWELLEIKQFLKDEKIAHSEDLNRFIIQNLYYFITVSILQRLVSKIVYLHNNNNSNADVLTDYKNLLQEYLRKVDPRIRRYLKGSRINIIDKIYLGYDTEYVALNHKENTLLSTQLSGTGTIVIRISNIDKGFDFTKSMLADGSMITDFKFDKILNKVPALYTTNQLIKEVISDLRGYMENSINNNFIACLESLCQRGLIIKSSETSDMIEYMVPLKELEGIPVYKNYFSFHEAGTITPSLEDLIDNSIDLTKDSVDERYEYFMDLLKQSNQVSSNTELTLIPEVAQYISGVGDSNIVNPFTPDNKHPNSLTDVMNKNDSFKGVLRGEHRRSKYIVMGCHFSISDLSLLSDFDQFKHCFDTVQNTLVTISRPYLMGKGKTLVLRDTMLLAPAGAASLDQIGALYGLPKVDIGDYITKMDELRDFNPVLFKEYALRDTIITLRHIIEMEKASFKITGIGNVPTTLSSLARRFVFKFWEEHKIDLNNFVYFNNFNIADFKSIYTPQGIQTTGNIGLILPMFMAGFRGGRNESYAYGIDRDNTWYDYDLVSAYTTAMSHLGIPDFNKARNILGAKALSEFIKNCEGVNTEINTGPGLVNKHNYDFTNSYSIFEVEFKFPSNTLHPCLPVSIDETSALYPLEGKTITTGYELYLAHTMGCNITLIRGTIIPFKSNKIRPYADVIKYLLEQRALYPKDTLYNLLYKQLGNSIYGQTGQGFRAYKRFNSRSNSLEDIGTSLLSNPVISSHITGLVRAVLGEVIRQVNIKGGKIISCTTDGLITNMPNLLNDLDLDSKLLSIYSGLREDISGSSNILEIKHAVKGIISWSTRGQLGIEPISTDDSGKTSKNISAMTGFQPRHFSMTERIDLVENAFKENSLTINFAQRSLRKVPDIFKDGGHVTAKVSEKSFRLVYDNRREIIDTGIHPSLGLLYSRPFLNKNIATTIKAIGKLGSDLYAPNSEYSIKSGSKDYNDIALRSFIRALLQNKLNLVNPYNNYNEIINFIDKTFDVKLKPSYIANQKRRTFIPNMVPYNAQTRAIVEKLVSIFPDIDTTKFYQN